MRQLDAICPTPARFPVARSRSPRDKVSQGLECRGDLQPLGLDKIEKLGGCPPVHFGLAVRVHGLEVVDGVLNVVGLVRRLARFLGTSTPVVRSSTVVAVKCDEADPRKSGSAALPFAAAVHLKAYGSRRSMPFVLHHSA
jgi:hypothetical protein